jgi:PIN domain nuclease of toxin-antitoxin system
MPDRIIAATGWSLNIPIISRDRKIKVSKIKTIW